MIAVPNIVYDKLIEIACNDIRRRFDNDHTYMAAYYIKEAEELGLPIEFINVLKQDAKEGK